MVNIGKMRQRVKIERLSVGVQDQSTGDIVNRWNHVREVWASVEPLSGREFIAAGAENAGLVARVVMRFCDVRRSDRIVHDGRFYDVRAVLADVKSGREYITLMVDMGGDDEGVGTDSRR